VQVLNHPRSSGPACFEYASEAADDGQVELENDAAVQQGQDDGLLATGWMSRLCQSAVRKAGCARASGRRTSRFWQTSRRPYRC
jgi:hypothetical protein